MDEARIIARIQNFLNNYLAECGFQPDSDPAAIQAALDQVTALLSEKVFLKTPGSIRARWCTDHIEIDFSK